MPFPNEELSSQPTEFEDRRATSTGNLNEEHLFQPLDKLKTKTFCNIQPGNLRFEHAGTLEHIYIKYDPMFPSAGRLHHIGFVLVNHCQPADASTTLSVDGALATAKLVSKNAPCHSISISLCISLLYISLVSDLIILPWNQKYIVSPKLCPGTDSKTQTKSLTRSPRSLAANAFLGCTAIHS